MGLIQKINITIQPHLTDGTLVPVLQDLAHTQAGFHLHLPSREQMPSKMRALLGFL